MKVTDDKGSRQTISANNSHKRSTRSEFDFIKQLRTGTSTNPPNSIIGDDAAVIKNSGEKETVITTDLLVEDIDFRRTTTPPYLLGHKALAVSLSDIAAMGARPRWSLISIGVPQDVWDTNFVDKFYEGFFELAGRYDVQLIGGDTSRTPEKVVIDSIVLGEARASASIKRSGASAGDHVFVTGSLGAAAAGLRLIERGAHLADQNLGEAEAEALDHLLLRHLRPDPRVGWGMILGQERLATAMIDLSDGLSSDLNHLCRESEVGVLVDSTQIPIDIQVRELCGRRRLDPLQLSLNGGEDFELLFTVKPENVRRLPRRVDGVGITFIGEIRPAAEGINLREGSRVWELKPEGWEHF
jgi:thiamine-monophosphate kinase